LRPPNLELVAEAWPNGLGPGAGAACPKVAPLVELPNGDGLGAAAPNALPDPNALEPLEVDPKGELDAAAGVDPKALLPELDPKGELEAGAGVAPKGLGAGAGGAGAAVLGAGADPKGLGAAVPKPVGGFDSVVPDEPNKGFVPPTEGREEATPLPNPNDAVGADAGADVVAEEEVVEVVG